MLSRPKPEQAWHIHHVSRGGVTYGVSYRVFLQHYEEAAVSAASGDSRVLTYLCTAPIHTRSKVGVLLGLRREQDFTRHDFNGTHVSSCEEYPINVSNKLMVRGRRYVPGPSGRRGDQSRWQVALPRYLIAFKICPNC